MTLHEEVLHLFSFHKPVNHNEFFPCPPDYWLLRSPCEEQCDARIICNNWYIYTYIRYSWFVDWPWFCCHTNIYKHDSPQELSNLAFLKHTKTILNIVVHCCMLYDLGLDCFPIVWLVWRLAQRILLRLHARSAHGLNGTAAPRHFDASNMSWKRMMK